MMIIKSLTFSRHSLRAGHHTEHFMHVISLDPQQQKKRQLRLHRATELLTGGGWV